MNPDAVMQQLRLSMQCTGAAQEESLRVLQSFETQPLFVSSLLCVMQAGAVDADIKMLATICLKNVVHRQWISRGSSRFVVSSDEKALLRAFLIGPALAESNRQLSLHLSILASKVARHDWPGEWPGVLEYIYSLLQSSSEWAVKRNAMVYLMRTLKELASKTMPSAKRAFQDIAVSMLPVMASTWRGLSSRIRVLFDSPITFRQADTAVEIEELCAHLSVCVNIISRLVIRCFPVVVKESYINSFFELLIVDMEYFASALRSNAVGACQVATDLHREQVLDDDSDADGGAETDGGDTDDEGGAGEDYSGTPLDQRHVYAVLKFVCQLRHLLRKTATIPTKLQKLHPTQMSPFLGPFLIFYLQQLSISYGYQEGLDLIGCDPLVRPSTGPARLCELHGLSVQAVLFLSNVLSCRDYCVDNRLSDPCMAGQGSLGVNAASDSTINSFLLSSFNGSSCSEKILLLLLRSLLVWTPRDIQEWVDDPEELLLAEEGEKESDSVRTAAQGLFYGLMDRSPGPTKALLRSVLVQLSQNSRLPPGEGMSSSITWEAVFLVAGLSGDKLFPHSFQSFSESNDGDCSGHSPSRADSTLNVPDEWIDNVLIPIVHRLIQQHDATIMSGASAPPQLILRRLFWLLTCWLYLIPAENTELLSRVLIMLIGAIEPRSQALSRFGSPGTRVVWVDVATAMQAALAIQTLVNADVLDVAVIAANFHRITSALCVLTGRFEEPELCAKVVGVIGDVVSSLCGRNLHAASQGAVQLRAAGLILPLAMQLYQMWTNSDENSPLRANLLDVFIKLARSAGCSARHETKFGNLMTPPFIDMSAASPHQECSCCSTTETAASLLHDILLRIILFSASGSTKVAHLAGSAVQLWLLLIRHSRRYTASLDLVFMTCLPRLFVSTDDSAVKSDDDDSPTDAVEMMSSDIQALFHVIEAYAIIYSYHCPIEASAAIVPFVVRYESSLVPVFRRVLGDLRAQVVSYVIRPLEVMFIISPEETFLFLGRNEFLSFLIRACLGSPLSAVPVTGSALQAAYSSHAESADIVIISYMHIIARAFLINQALTMQVISTLTESVRQPVAAGMELFMLHFIEKMDSVGFNNMISGSYHKRLWAFSMLSMFPFPQCPQLNAIVAGDAMAIIDGLKYSDPYSNVSPYSVSWTELIEELARNFLRVMNDEDDDDEEKVSDDGAEYDFDSAIGGKGSQVPGIPGGQKLLAEKEIVVEIFEKIICRDNILSLPLDTFMADKISEVTVVVGHDAARQLFAFE